MKPVYVIGAYTTDFKRWPEKSHRDLAREAYLGAIADSGIDQDLVESVWSGNTLLHNWGQTCIRGHVILSPMIQEGIIPSRTPIWNVEGGCATGSLTIQGACRDILSGNAQVSVAIGYEKLFIPNDPVRTIAQIQEGIDQMHPEEWQAEFRKLGEVVGTSFETGADRSLAMDTYSTLTKYHMMKYGTTQKQLAIIAAKTHNNGSLNPKAQYKFKMTPEEVLADRVVSYPLTRSMCAPTGDGAAAAVLCSEEFYKNLPAAIQKRCIKIIGCGLSSGKPWRAHDEVGLSRIAADRAYASAGIAPEDIDLAEVHDATSFGEIYQAEMLRLCPIGEGGRLAESGETMIGGRIPINTSGGLISKGHPLAATGISMMYELMTQLRGEAGERQVKNAEFAIEENGGGGIGLEDAACSVMIFQKAY